MDNLLSFPTQPVRDRASIERSIRNVMLKEGASLDLVATVIGNMAGFLDIALEPLVLPAGAGRMDGLPDAIAVGLQERTQRLIIERLNAEIAHCR